MRSSKEVDDDDEDDETSSLQYLAHGLLLLASRIICRFSEFCRRPLRHWGGGGEWIIVACPSRVVATPGLHHHLTSPTANHATFSTPTNQPTNQPTNPSGLVG